jgi:hypothetical protein
LKVAFIWFVWYDLVTQQRNTYTQKHEHNTHNITKERSTHTMEILDQQMTTQELDKRFPKGVVDVIVRVDLDDLITRNEDEVFDFLESLVLNGILGNISYSIAGHEGESTILMRVVGDVMETYGE